MSAIFMFRGWSFDAAAGELTSPAGEAQILPAQTAQLLEALLESSGTVVPRDELYTRLWGDQFVDHEHGLNFCVRQLRIHLSDDAREPVFIETIRGRGYRFIATVERDRRTAAAGPELAPKLRHLAAVLITGAFSLWASSSSELITTSQPEIEPSRLLQEARYLEAKNNVPDLRRAILRYQSAIARSPESARAFSGLARAHYKLGLWGGVPRIEALRSSRDAAAAALALDGGSCEAHLTFGVARLYLDLDWSAAEGHFADSVACDPLNAEARLWNARAMAAGQRYHEALAEAELALAIDPESRAVLSDMAWFSYFARDYKAAVETSRRVLSLEPQAWASLECLQLSYLAEGDAESARKVSEEIIALVGQSTEQTHEVDLESPDWLRMVAEMMDASCPMKSFAVESARLYTFAGDDETAITLLKRGLSDRVWWSPFVMIDPTFHDLRRHPGFRDLVRELNLS